jgi:hypothetical protein
VTAAEKVHAAIRVLSALAETIRSLGSVPSGHLYAQVLGQLDLADYQAAIGHLVRAGLVEEGADRVLVWVGPEAAR